MKKWIALVLSGLLLTANGSIAEESIFSEPKLWGDNIRGTFSSVASLPDGGIIFVGSTMSEDTLGAEKAPNPLAVSVLPNGQLRWRVELINEDFGFGSFAHVYANPDGSATCVSWHGDWITISDQGVAKTDTMEWNASETFLMDSGRWVGVNVDDQENILTLLLLDKDRNQTWTRAYSELRGLSIFIVTELVDGSFLCIGRDGLSKCYSIKLGADGTLLGHHEIPDFAYISLAKRDDGGAIALCEVYDSPFDDPAKRVLLFDSNGQISNEHELQLAAGNHPSTMIQVSEGYLVQCSESLVLLDENGMVMTEWSHPSLNGGHIIQGLLVNSGECIYLVAEISTETRRDNEAFPLVVYEISMSAAIPK